MEKMTDVWPNKRDFFFQDENAYVVCNAYFVHKILDVGPLISIRIW